MSANPLADLDERACTALKRGFASDEFARIREEMWHVAKARYQPFARALVGDRSVSAAEDPILLADFKENLIAQAIVAGMAKTAVDLYLYFDLETDLSAYVDALIRSFVYDTEWNVRAFVDVCVEWPMSPRLLVHCISHSDEYMRSLIEAVNDHVVCAFKERLDVKLRAAFSLDRPVNIEENPRQFDALFKCYLNERRLGSETVDNLDDLALRALTARAAAVFSTNECSRILQKNEREFYFGIPFLGDSLLGMAIAAGLAKTALFLHCSAVPLLGQLRVPADVSVDYMLTVAIRSYPKSPTYSLRAYATILEYLYRDAGFSSESEYVGAVIARLASPEFSRFPQRVRDAICMNLADIFLVECLPDVAMTD